jgi:hypothetical protein
MKTYSKIDSLLFVVKKNLLDSTEECIDFLIEREVILESEEDDIDSLELLNMALNEAETLSEDELEILIMSNDLYLGINNFDIFDIEKVSKEIDWNVDKWVANCYAVSSAIVDAGLIQGKAVFGKYHGFINENSFFKKSTFTNHGWILTKDGKIIDPTRWVFENTNPYIYICDSDNNDYDQGSNVIKNILSSLQNVPVFDDSLRVITIDNEEIEHYFSELLGKEKIPHKISINQILSIASSSVNTLGCAAKPIFTWLNEKGLSAFVPIDNFEMIMN